MMSNDALILGLAADLSPVKRRSSLRDGLWLVAIAAVELAIVLVAGAMRPDMGRMILTPYMIWKMGSLALLAGVSCTVAMRSFAPPASQRRGLAVLLSIVVLAVVCGLFLTSSAESGQSLAARLSPEHGMICTAAIVVLATPMVAALAVLMRRAAPVRPGRSALVSGLAASTCGALVFTAGCPMNDPLYIITWYTLGVVIVAALARWLLPRRFRL